MGLLLVMLGQNHGYPVPRGGAGKLTEALVKRLEASGGHIETGAHVAEVVVRSGRAVGVRLDSGEVIEAGRAILADVSAPALFGGLVPWSELPDRLRRRMRSFEWDAGTIKVDWALSGPIPWAASPELIPGTVHLADSVAELAIAGAQLGAGRVPDRGLIVLGQMAATDPTRAPEGSESVWAYLHVPQRVSVADQPLAEPVDQARAEQVATEVESRIAEFAPGFRDLVLDRRVLGPTELERRNENLVGGAVNGGTAAIHQQLFWRPVPGLGRAETPIQGLYLASASAHPGGGVHGACGSNAARAALFHDRLRLAQRRLIPVSNRRGG
jgi:phytoene dehydrogenase-like protein